MTHAQTLLAEKLLKSNGLDPSWIGSESPLGKELQHWIVDTLTMENNMTDEHNEEFPPNPYVILLIFGCCESNYSERNVDKLFRSQDVLKMIEQIVFKHFPITHKFYRGNEIEDPAALLGAAPSILFFWLNRRNGLPNNWINFEVSQVMGNFSLWIRHRLADHMKSKSNEHLINTSTYQKEDHSNQNHEDWIQAQSTDPELTQGTDDVLISMSEAQTKGLLNAFVFSIPMIAIEHATSMIHHSDDSWNLFVKLNPINILQWLMANPLYCDNTEVFDLLCQHADVPISTITTWKNNLPELVMDIESSECSQGTKAKDYTLLAFSAEVKTIEELRQLPHLKRHRETLRRRNNNTHAGLYTLCLLACLTLKGTNTLGINLLESILVFYQKSAQKIVPEGRWLLTEDFLSTWNHNDSTLGKLRRELLNVISLVRYETEFEKLSQNKQMNVLKIHRISKSIGQHIAHDPSIPVIAR